MMPLYIALIGLAIVAIVLLLNRFVFKKNKNPDPKISSEEIAREEVQKILEVQESKKEEKK